MKALAIVALVTACNGFDPPAQTAGRAHPIANAGTGSSYPLGTTVTLDGSGSYDPDGSTLAYSWSVEQSPSGSTSLPADAGAATTTFVLDQLGTYLLKLQVTDDAQNTDASELKIVSTGAITGIDAGPPGTASWLGTAQLAGTVTTAPGTVATYSWAFVSRPAGSIATLANAESLNPTFDADAAGTFVIALDARVGDEVREDTTTVQVAPPSGLSLGTGIAAYSYSKSLDRIVYVHDVGHAEIVEVDPTTGAQTVLDIGPFTPRSIAPSHDTSQLGEAFAVGGVGRVAVVAASPLHLLSARYVPGCTAKHVTLTGSARVDCFPEDGTIEPIRSVNMTTAVITQTPCPVQFPDATQTTQGGGVLMVDGASPQIYLYDTFSTPGLSLISHGSLTGITAPVIATPNAAITGNGLVVNADATLRFDLHTTVSAGAYADHGQDMAVVSSDAVLKVFFLDGTLSLSAVIPPVNGVVPTTKLVAYSFDDHRLFVVAGTAAGDILYMVPR